MDRNALLAATRAEFLQGFMQAADHAMAQAKIAVFRKADLSFAPPERRALLDLHRILQDRQPELRLHLQRNMEQLLNRSFQTAYSTFRPTFSKEFSGYSLSLLDTSQFEDQLRVDEITNKFRNAADQQLRDLNIRIALLFEQNTIKERENPFRPWLFTRCIASAVEALGIRAELLPVACVHIAEQLEESVAVIYNGINGFLADNGIAAQLQLKIQRTAGAGPTSDGGRADNASVAAAIAVAPGAGGIARFDSTGQPAAMLIAIPFPPSQLHAEAAQAASTANLHEMMQRVRQYASAGTDGSSLTPFAAAPGQNMPVQGDGGSLAQVEDAGLTRNALGELMRRFLTGGSAIRNSDHFVSGIRSEPGPGSKVDRDVGAALAQSVQTFLEQPANIAVQDAAQPVRNLIFEQRATLVGAAGDTNEQMTIDVVAMLFEFILRDHQIPAEGRAQLGRLQFLVLKIALRESTLLTQQGHPARMLVNRIGSISIGLRQLDPRGARISTEICRIVESLLSSDSSSSTPFSTMLDEFDSFIANEFRSGNVQIERAVQVIEGAQRRAVRYTHLAAQLDEALFGLSIDAFLRDFMMNSWTYVIERAERTQDATAIRFRQLVPELLWSIVPRTAADNRTELLSLLPTIVRTIRDGLLLIEWDSGRQQTVLDWLVQAHRSVLRGVPEAIPAPTLQSMKQHFARFIAGAAEEIPVLTAETADVVQQQIFLDQAIREADGAVRQQDDAQTGTEPAQASVGIAGQAPAESPRSETTIALPSGLMGLSDLPEVRPGSGLAGHATLVIADADASHSAQSDFGDNAANAATDDLVDADILARLGTGVALMLKLGDVAGRAQLTWIDQKKSTLVLSIEGQPAPMLISMRMFRRMYAGGRLQFIETAPLFERAIASVQKSAGSM